MSSPNGFEFSFLPLGRARGGSSDPCLRVGRKDEWELVVAEHRLGLEALELGLEVREVIEAPVDAREQQRRHAVEPDEAAQHALPDPLGVDLPATPPRLARDPVGELLELAHLHRALVGRAQHSADELVAVELLALPVALAHNDHRALGPLVGRVALAAARALAPATDRIARINEPGVHYTRGLELAIGTAHNVP